jgi:hypothetical protein
MGEEDRNMGIAAYNRSSQVIRSRISMDARPAEFEIMDRLNALEKYPDCGRINENLLFTFSHGVWCVNVERKPDGFSYWYKTLHEAVKRWNVEIIGFNNGVWIGKPR